MESLLREWLVHAYFSRRHNVPGPSHFLLSGNPVPDFALLPNYHAALSVHPKQDGRPAHDEVDVRRWLIADRDYVAAVLVAQDFRPGDAFFDAMIQERFIAAGEREVPTEQMRQPMHLRHWNAAVPRAASEMMAAEAGVKLLAIGNLDDSVLAALS